MKVIMDKEQFEEAIAKYTTKVVDKSNPEIVEFVYNRKPKTFTINLITERDRFVAAPKVQKIPKVVVPTRKKGIVPNVPLKEPKNKQLLDFPGFKRRCWTPLGEFDSVFDASKAYNLTPNSMIQRIYTKRKTSKDWGVYD